MPSHLSQCYVVDNAEPTADICSPARLLKINQNRIPYIIRTAFACLCVAVCAIQGAHAASDASPEPEPNAKTALKWWPPQRGVWTPIGWKDHLFRFNVMYNGTLLCAPMPGGMSKPNTKAYEGQDFQLTFFPGPDGKVPDLPESPELLYKTDRGFGIQGWMEDRETPVLWTEWPRQEGIVLRQEVFAHMKGGQEVGDSTAPLYAWVRLSVSHVDEIRAPEKFSVGVQLSRTYYKNVFPYAQDDSCAIEVQPQHAPLSGKLKSEPLAGNGLKIVQDSGETRLVALGGVDGRLSFDDATSGIYVLNIELPARVGAYIDVLVPMLPALAEELQQELALGRDGALAQCEDYWSQKPQSAARIHTPEPYINEALRRNIQFAQIIAEKDPETGLRTFLSGSYGYDVLWATPTSMISHMFLDLLGYHDAVASHMELFKAHQGTVKPPGDSYTTHSGYFSTPRTLTSFDWLTDHGAVLHTLTQHALLTGDKQFIEKWTEPVLKGVDFIIDSCAITNHEGYKGLMPPAKATDTGVPSQAVWNQAWTFKAFATASSFLYQISHPRATEVAAFTREFQSRFRSALVEATEKRPEWTDKDGKKHKLLPYDLVPAPEHHIFDDCAFFDAGPIVCVWAGLLNADDELMRTFLRFFREGPNGKLRSTRPNPIDRVVLENELSSCEPCYSWNIVHSWQLGDRQKFLEGMYGLFTGGISPDTYINGEHRHGMYGTVFVAPLMTWCLRQSVIDDQLSSGQLHLLRLCPTAWVTKDEDTVFENMPTIYGPVNLRFRLGEDGKRLKVNFSGKWRQAPAKIMLHVPPVDGLEEITLNDDVYRVGEPIEVSLP